MSIQNKTNLVQVRIDSKTKNDLELILDDLGLTTSQAIYIYIKQILIKRKIPFDISLNSNTITKFAKYDDSGLSNSQFQQLQDMYLAELDKSETLPEYHLNNAKPFVIPKKKSSSKL